MSYITVHETHLEIRICCYYPVNSITLHIHYIKCVRVLSTIKELQTRRADMSVSPGQTDWQVVASGRKLNLRRDLRLVAKRTRKFPRKYTQVEKKTLYSRLSCISLADNRLIDVTQLALTWVGWPNGEKLASTYVQI